MNYISVKQAAKLWQISERRVRCLCADGRIEGAARHGDWAWSIPETTARPIDGRCLRFIKNTGFRTGSQNYTDSDKKKGKKLSIAERDAAISDSIYLSLSLDGISISPDQINDILDSKIVPGIDLFTHILVRNIASELEFMGDGVSDYNIRMANTHILTSADNSARGRFAGNDQQHQFTTLTLQYQKDWSALHPIARATFLFGELLRIKPFCLANGGTAVCMLQLSLASAGYRLCDIPSEKVDELKAALASTGLRGNYQMLITMIREAIV